MTRFLGIYREPLMSPNRESDDAKILQAVAAELERLGGESELADAKDALKAVEGSYDIIAPMCEEHSVLLSLMEHPRPGVFVNPPRSVLACYRTTMVPLLQATPQADFPLTEIRLVAEGGSMPAFMREHGGWIKRGDVHNTCDHDVVGVKTQAEFDAVVKDFSARGIRHMVLQEHQPGDLIKFYGVGPGRWFTWFYHNPAQALKLPFELDRMEAATCAAAAALGLEVYGGDAIVTADGRIRLIDINSWPSFARVRNEASVQIARHIHERARRVPAGALPVEVSR